MQAHITLLPGDGIGPEVVELTRGLLEAVAEKFGIHSCSERHSVCEFAPGDSFTGANQNSPVRPELLSGVDILFVRELTSGAYFGEKHEPGSGDVAWDTMIYTVGEVRHVVEVVLKATCWPE